MGYKSSLTSIYFSRTATCLVSAVFPFNHVGLLLDLEDLACAYVISTILEELESG